MKKNKEILSFADEGFKRIKPKLDPAMLGKLKYERYERDSYFTPEWCTKVLLNHYPFFKTRVWEPACGVGNISKVLMDAGHIVYSSDIHNYSQKFHKQNHVGDFLEENFYDTDNDIITNPPYYQAKRFVDNALKLTKKEKGRVAMLLRNEWDSAKTRTYLFNKPPFACKLVLTTRPKWIEDSKKNPRHNFSWFIWDWKHEGPAFLKYASENDV